MAKLKRQTKPCQGCGDPFLTYRNYDYCVDCAVNGNRYLTPSSCSECDGSGMIKFRRQPPHPCKLCALTKTMTNFKKTISQKPTVEELEQQFWNQVETTSKSLIADLIEKVLPLSITSKNFDLEKDVDYRVLLRDDLPNYYGEMAEYQTKITDANWTEEDVEYVAQDLTCAYFELVIKSLVDWLSAYPTFANTSLSNYQE